MNVYSKIYRRSFNSKSTRCIDVYVCMLSRIHDMLIMLFIGSLLQLAAIFVMFLGVCFQFSRIRDFWMKTALLHFELSLPTFLVEKVCFWKKRKNIVSIHTYNIWPVVVILFFFWFCELNEFSWFWEIFAKILWTFFWGRIDYCVTVTHFFDLVRSSAVLSKIEKKIQKKI